VKITVDRTKCEGYARCVQAAPKVFQLDSKMIAEVVDPQGDGDDKILLAARLCPTKQSHWKRKARARSCFQNDQSRRSLTCFETTPTHHRCRTNATMPLLLLRSVSENCAFNGITGNV
jgi:ferredoxin